MKDSKPHIIFCSSSYCEFDRRMNRIIECLHSEFQTSWLSRRYKSEEYAKHYVSHLPLKMLFKSGVLFYTELNLKIFIKLLFAKCDMVSAVDLDTLVSAYLACLIRRKKLIFDSHEIFHEVPELMHKPFRQKLWFALSKLLFNKINYKYTVNISLKNYFKEHFDSNFGVIRNVPKLIKRDQLPIFKNKALCYLGAVNLGRGVELAIESLHILKDYSLVVIGDGDCFDEMKEKAKIENLEDRILFLGYVDPELIFFHMLNCSIALNLLDPHSDNYHYSLANKFFDYIHAALPSLNMRFPEYEAINEEYNVSVLVNDYTVEALCEGVTRLANPELYNSIQKNCITAREVFNWQKEKAKLLNFYK